MALNYISIMGWHERDSGSLVYDFDLIFLFLICHAYEIIRLDMWSILAEDLPIGTIDLMCELYKSVCEISDKKGKDLF